MVKYNKYISQTQKPFTTAILTSILKLEGQCFSSTFEFPQAILHVLSWNFYKKNGGYKFMLLSTIFAMSMWQLHRRKMAILNRDVLWF